MQLFARISQYIDFPPNYFEKKNSVIWQVFFKMCEICSTLLYFCIMYRLLYSMHANIYVMFTFPLMPYSVWIEWNKSIYTVYMEFPQILIHTAIGDGCYEKSISSHCLCSSWKNDFWPLVTILFMITEWNFTGMFNMQVSYCDYKPSLWLFKFLNYPP